MLAVSFTFISLNHPITLGLGLITHTLVVGILTGILVRNFWFSYILFLVFLGGVLVLFIYITRLASNEKFSFTWRDLLIFAIFGFMCFIGACLIFIPSIDLLLPSLDWGVAFGGGSVGSGLMFKLYSSGSYLITLFLIFYLLYALVVCANLVGGYPGALRNFN